MAGNTFTEIEIHPEELEDNQDTPIRDSIFASKSDEEEAVQELGSWITSELSRSMAARHDQERSWEVNLRQYEAVAEHPTKNVPIENASNLEIPLGAIAADALYAQMLNLIFNIDPLITVREIAESGKLKDHIKALQRFVDVLGKSKLRLRNAVENALLDDVKLGTGILYIRWGEKRKKTQVDTVTERGPLVKGVPLEDFFVPGGGYDDIQTERWVGMRMWLTQHELNLRERDLNWDIEGVLATQASDRIRQLRERLGHHDGFGQKSAGSEESTNNLFQIFDIYCLFDIDGDGIDEDLLVTYDWGSKRVLKWRFSPYDRRPFEVMRYQLREYLFYGMGVVEMLRPFQMGATNLYNHWVDNSLLANTRFWVGKHGAVPNNQLRIWPNRFLPVSNPGTDIIPHTMADTFASAPAALQTTVSFAEKRTGVNDLTSPRPSSVLGSRTPGITAISMLQKANERFGPAFDGARIATSSSVRQALFRYQERLLARDIDTETDIIDLLGEEQGALVIELLADKQFDNNVSVELTASSAATNRESERQNWLTLVGQVVTIGEKIMELASVIENPQAGPLVKDTAKQLVQAANEILDRTLRTFDQVRDPGAFLIDLQEQLEEADAQQPDASMQALAGAMDQLVAGVPGGEEVTGGAPVLGGAVGG